METYQLFCRDRQNSYSVHYGIGRAAQTDSGVRLHYDGDMTLSWFIHCRGTIRIEGRCYPISDGDMIILNPGEIHCRTIEEGSTLEVVSIYVNRSLLQGLPYDSSGLFAPFLHREGGHNNRIPAGLVTRYGLDRAAKDILDLTGQPGPEARLLTVCRLAQLLSGLGSACSALQSTQEGGKSGSSLVDEVLHYINAHFKEDLSCTQLADRFYLSRFRLEHLFREHVGVPLWEYVILKRLAFVNELIRQDHSVSEAAYAAGFRNYTNFYRLYKRHMNITPAEYKKQTERTGAG